MDSNELYLGIAYGPSKLQLGLVQRDGHIVQAASHPLENQSDPDPVARILDAAAGFLAESGCPRPHALGVGLPGYINPERGIWMHCLNMGISAPVPITAPLRQALQMPVSIDNDLNAATLAENYFGVGRICRDFLFVNADEGVAMGIVSGGRLIRGVANCAGELGHVTAETDGALCACNSRGCLENIVSCTRLIEGAKEELIDYPDSLLAQVKPQSLNVDDIFRCAQSGDTLALHISHRAIRALGIGLVNSINLLNPEHIVVAGSVCRNQWFVDQVKKYVYTNGFVSTVATLKDFTRSSLNPEHIQLLGAAGLCFVREGL